MDKIRNYTMDEFAKLVENELNKIIMTKSSCLFLILLLSSTIPSSGQSNPKKITQTKITYSSPIRPNYTNWHLEEVYMDTLTYLFYNDTYDLPYAIFKNELGDTTALYYDINEHNNKILKIPSGSVFEIKWKIENFYEPGEHGETYFGESLLSYKIITR